MVCSDVVVVLCVGVDAQADNAAEGQPPYFYAQRGSGSDKSTARKGWKGEGLPDSPAPQGTSHIQTLSPTRNMPEVSTIKDYDIHVYWDSRAEYFVAEIQEIYACAADGATQAEALSNLEETFAVLKEAYSEEKLALPRPNPELPISVGELSVLSDVIKVSRLAELSGIPVQTLATKMNRGTELSVAESRRVSRALEESGLALRSTGNSAIKANDSTRNRMRQPGLDNRHRDLTGQIDKKHGNTLLKSLRKQYGQHLAPGRRSDMMLRTLREEAGGKSLSKILKGRPNEASRGNEALKSHRA